jgi:hypothetical protein
MPSRYYCGACRLTFTAPGNTLGAVRQAHRNQAHGGGIPDHERVWSEAREITVKDLIAGAAVLLLIAGASTVAHWLGITP